jgi:hypothetical protein
VRKAHERPWKFLVINQKRRFQQYLPIRDSLPLYWKPSGTSNAINRLCLRGLPGGEPAASEGDYFTC